MRRIDCFFFFFEGACNFALQNISVKVGYRIFMHLCFSCGKKFSQLDVVEDDFSFFLFIFF